MKVVHKILVPPAIAALFLVLLGAVSFGVLHRQNAALEQLAGTRFAAYQATTDAAQDLSQVHSGVYRLITWLSSLKEDQITTQTRAQTVRLDDVKARMTAFVEGASAGAEERKLAELAMAELAKYRRSVLSAVDLSSGDTLTGATAMQLADKQFQTTQKHFEELVKLEKRLAAESAQAAAATFRFAVAVLAGITVAALVLSALIAVLLSRRIVRPLHIAIGAAARIADGDLSTDLKTQGTDETAQLLRGLGDMTQRLRQLVGEVAGGANAVADTSNQIAQGNLDLSQRTEEQASTLEETASSIQQLTATVTQNADNARQASQLAVDASGVARKGGQVVREVVTTMNEISASSRRIADIISVIDGIAFQTNILALNAAVEAARAGEQGRGFAVVAAEVRSLAQRSADAAREIKGLIGDSVGKVEAGTRLVDTAGNTMEEVVAAAKRVSDLIAEIAAASVEQSEGIRQVNTAITQMDNVVQQNASLVEEAAAATESMKAQAAGLMKIMERFRLGAAHSIQRPAAVAPPGDAKAPAAIRVRTGELPAPMAALLVQAKARTAKPAPSGEWRQF